ncbi:hypothetical protein [Fulvimonas soli]|uniref:hypothetical protein n=1 Tax=Fulvimonas soli TaxID=155197 RepID=UPI000D6A8B10|nr:hypothetical protein [Fulvimonas soli]
MGIEKSLVAKKNSAVKRNGSGDSPYHLRISRLTVDKLGVKLYDKASAVVAELDLPPLSRTK